MRQGDPLSYLLFDLTIEPLACILCTSPKLQEYNIPSLTNCIIVNLYADDTTIYLSKQDKYMDLEEILQPWCRASRAKFNLEKTENLPIGSKNFRAVVAMRRTLNEADQPWSEEI